MAGVSLHAARVVDAMATASRMIVIKARLEPASRGHAIPE
jgi:hypothetical protein